MTNEKSKAAGGKPAAAAKSSAPAPRVPASPPPPIRVPRLFRRVDWLTFLISFAAVWIGYYLTLAPELTLEDSGELATGSFYAGIPHPPGYPVWTIYTWLWTVLLPIKNIAWRVALAEATGGAMAAGLLGLLVSRGSSMLIEGIEDFRGIVGRWESFICLVAGFVAAMLIGFNGFMWSQSVIVEVYSFGVASLMVVLLCLLRWVHAPFQRRYLYLALFFHGICFTNHQTLIVAAIGIEVAIAAADFRMGRYLFFGNSILFFAGLVLNSQGMLSALDQNPAVYLMFMVVGVCSLIAYGWFMYLTKQTFPEMCLDACLTAFVLLACVAIGQHSFFLVLLALAALGAVIKFAIDTWKIGYEWLVVILLGVCWILGASFYFYMPLAGMTDPPMQWGYPRTVEGFIHAFTRGQYEKMTPSDIAGDPFRFLNQIVMLGVGIKDEFNLLFAFLALVPFLFFFKMHKRERAWIIGLVAIYFCLGFILLYMLNPSPDRASQELNRVFFTASHTIVALMVGYGVTLIAAYMATHYQRFRTWGMVGGGVAIALALYSLVDITSKTFFPEDTNPSLGQLYTFMVSTFTNKDQYGLPVYAGLTLTALALIYFISLLVYRNRAPLAITLAVFAIMPVYSVMTHWSDNEQRDHWFGYWFGHDMFTPPFKGKDGKPLYPEMERNAVLYGGTDPGRFCPTYMIFCDSFLPSRCLPEQDPNFDRRDVYIITQNALADGTYLNYIRAQFNRSTQTDPPFFREFFRTVLKDSEYNTNVLARLSAPLDVFFTDLGAKIEKNRATFTSWFQDDAFIDLPDFVKHLRASPDQDAVSKFLRENLKPDTIALVDSKTDGKDLREALCRDLNKLLNRELETREMIAAKKNEKAQLIADEDPGSLPPKKAERLGKINAELAELEKVAPLYTPERFKGVEISEYLKVFIAQNPQSYTRVRLNRLLLEAAYPKDIAKSKGGVYPDREIYIATPEDSQKCFTEYLNDAQKRLQHDAQFPNEQRQIKPGEDVKVIDNRVQVSGQVAVMSINGLLTKVMFDHNPQNEFYVEESFPLDWMYPHLTPFGIIMKINREQLPELTEDMVQRDHEFWSQFSGRLIGNWITYDTSVREIADFVEKTYLKRDFTGFKGDRRFVRDDQGQKAFSKLRSSIAGVYAWRISDPKNTSPAVQQRMIKEADFAFRQAFAFCPYSPEAVFRYTQLLLGLNRIDDALIIAETCQKLDPFNGQVVQAVKGLRAQRDAMKARSSNLERDLEQMQKTFKDNPNDFQNAFNLASAYLGMRLNSQAVQVLDGVMNNPKVDPSALRALVQAFQSIGDQARVQTVIAKLEARWNESKDAGTAAGLLEGYKESHQNEKLTNLLEQVLSNPKLDAGGALLAAREYAGMGNLPKLELSLERLTQVSPESPEAWYDLGALKASLGKGTEAIANLQHAIELSAGRLQKDPKAKDLKTEARTDTRFASLHGRPEFEKLVAK